MSGRMPSLASSTSRVALASRQAALRSRSIPSARLQSASRTYATEIPAPKRRFLPRFLLWTTAGLTLFYSGSTVVAANNEAYADFFSNTVPFGEDILDYLETHDVASEARRLDYGGIGSQVIDSAGAGYNRVADAARRLTASAEDAASEAGEKARSAEKAARAKMEEAREQARKQVAKIRNKEEEARTKAEKEAPKVEARATELKKEAQSKAEDAKEKSQEVAESVRAKAASLIQQGRAAAEKAEAEAKKGLRSLTGKAEEAADKVKPYDRSLPVSHEAPQGYSAPRGERKLVAESDPNTRLRPDPKAVKLPQLAPALSSLTGSEPMIGQLAGTIDDLAAFLRDTPASSTNAKYVLEEAKEELQGLSKRLDFIRKSEQARAERSLSEQAKKFEAELKSKTEEQNKKYSQLDAEGKKKLEQERVKAGEEYRARLEKELETQRGIINERLKEEVVAQGVEMQKRWMREIKQRVEQERGGRLARLDQLATDLGEIEKVTMSNSAALQEGSDAHRTAAAVRALIKAAIPDATDRQDIDASSSSSDAPSLAGFKHPFRKEITLLSKTDFSQQSDLVKTALSVLESTTSPDEGVESLSSLTSWYIQRVKPRLQSVALLPEQAGLVSHMASSLFSPLLFTKVGNVPGTDVPSILARAEYNLLQRGDLDSAAREINSLKGWPKVLAGDWLKEARKRLEVEQSLKLIQSESAYNSLLNA